jgi:hypothetical protein
VDRRTDITELIVASRNFANAPKNSEADLIRSSELNQMPSNECAAQVYFSVLQTNQFILI